MSDIPSVKKAKLKGVLVFTLQHHEDHRGSYTQLYHHDAYEKLIQKNLRRTVEFLHDDYAYSTKNVLRGIHGDARTWKLVSCLQGKFYLVVVNCDKSSRQFGTWERFILTRENGKQILVPPNFGLAYLVLSHDAIFHYKQSAYYQGKEHQFTYRWDDPQFAIWWPVKNPILSLRDECQPLIKK